MKHRDYITISKIIEELTIAEDLIEHTTQQEFENDEMRKRATAMTVINVGELVKIISDETRTAYPDIPWKQAAGFRDVAAHKYQTLNMGDVYDTVKNDFPVFKIKLQSIIHKTINE